MTNAQLVGRKLTALIEFSARARKRRPASVEILANDTERQDARDEYARAIAAFSSGA